MAVTTTTPATTTTSGFTSAADFEKSVDTYAQEAPSAPAPVTTNVTSITPSQNEFIAPTSGQVGAAPSTPVATGTALAANTPQQVTNAAVAAHLTGPRVDPLLDKFDYASGSVDKASTVRGQMEGLMSEFEGGNTPVWAAGALRSANDKMAARGLGASSMAGAANTQAAMEAALPIAAQDAKANLDMQFANLDNEQQMLLQKNEARTQSFFTDAATVNATRQFNATNANQVKQFNANLASEVNQFNVAQRNAMTEFNTGEVNAMTQFRASMVDARQRFNASNRLVIDQSNAEWRRAITTQNNATQNEANRVNAQLASDMTMAEYNNSVQYRRDAISYAFTASENAQTRASELLLAMMSSEEARAARTSASRDALFGAAGSIVAAWFR